MENNYHSLSRSQNHLSLPLLQTCFPFLRRILPNSFPSHIFLIHNFPLLTSYSLFKFKPTNQCFFFLGCFPLGVRCRAPVMRVGVRLWSPVGTWIKGVIRSGRLEVKEKSKKKEQDFVRKTVTETGVVSTRKKRE